MATLTEFRKSYPQYNDMSDQDLADALHKKYYANIPKADYYSKIGLQGANQGENRAFSPSNQTSIGEDLSNLPGNIASELGDVATDTPMGLYNTFVHPIRTGGNLIAGAAEGGKAILNAPRDLKEYLKSKSPGFKQIANVMEQANIQSPFMGPFPGHLGDTGLEQAILGDEQMGDKSQRFVGSLFGGGEVAKLAKLIEKSPTLATLSSIKSTAGSLSGSTLKGLTKEAAKVEEKLGKSEKALSTTQEQAEIEHGSKNINTLIRQHNKAEAALRDLKNTELPELPLPKLSRAYLNETKEALLEGSGHGLHVQQAVKRGTDAIKNKISSAYNDIEAAFKADNSMVEIPREQYLSEIERDLTDKLQASMPNVDIKHPAYVQFCV